MLENNNYDEKKNVRKKLIMTITLVVITVALGIGGVYAYFAAAVTQDTTSSVSINAVSGLAISFSHGQEINMGNVLPGQSWTKTFSAKLINNETNIEVGYSINIYISKNTFNQSRGYLTYTLEGAENTSGTINKLTEGDFPLIQNKTIKGNKNTSNVTHSYTLTITYPNDETSVQEQGGEFSGYVYFTASNNEIKYEPKTYATNTGTTKKITELAVGDEIVIGTEHFYVLPVNANNDVVDSDGNIHALAEWNLDLDGTGMQSENNWDTTAFSDDSQTGTNNSDYKGSIVEGYVNTYVNDVLKPIAGEEITITGRLITLEELELLGCILRWYTCSPASSWVYQISYWSGSPYASDMVYGVSYLGDLGGGNSSERYLLGVRPVIVF